MHDVYMPLSHLTSPTAVKMALAEYDRLGSDLFRRKYKFGSARTYFLRYDGKEYDSKAIAGVAHGYQFPELGPLSNEQFTGGKLSFDAGGHLLKLGFDIATMKRNPNDWTLVQCEVTVKAYFDCLSKKMAGQPFIRSHVLDTVAQTIERSRDAVDYEFQNIDGILFEAGLPRLNRATAKNVQRLLRYVTLDPLAQHSEVFESSKRIVVTTSTEEVFVEALIIDASILDLDNDVSSLKATKIDFSRRDAANRNLGRSGEEFVLELEQKRLKELGRPDLAEKVRWVSKDDGDGLGYDIASFEVDETPIYIEVKTTNQGEAAPFYVSETERQVAELRGEAYILYRVFDLSDSPKVYRIRGPFSERLMMRPVNYIALPIS